LTINGLSEPSRSNGHFSGDTEEPVLMLAAI